MIHIFDGNNVMLRDMTKLPLDGQKPMSLRMRYQAAAAAPPGTHIWVFDGRAHNKRRRDIFPAYKAQRQPMAEDMFATIHLWREMLAHTNAIVVDCDGWEADDVIASLVSRFVTKKVDQVTVHTNDFDYWQLQVFKAVSINGIKPKAIVCEPQFVPLYKAFRGDPSDNIPGVPGFGPKAWEALAGQYGKLEMAVKSGRIRDFEPFPFTARVGNWLVDPTNILLLQQMYQITKFLPVPDADLNAGIRQGTLNLAAAEALLQRFFL